MVVLWLTMALAEPCVFDASVQVFDGTAVDQATCLLRPVRRYAHLGPPRVVPQPLLGLIGQPVGVSPERFRAFVNAHGLDMADLGGDVHVPLSRGNNNHPDGLVADYFVIHDTSTPIANMNGPFPDGINTEDWPGNDLSVWQGRPIAHVFVNRLGQSITTRPFSEPNWATKLERDRLDRTGGRMLHIELVQPRRRDPNGGARNDAIAPEPGFTDAQLDRLALLYLAASIRRGQWLIPAFHSVVDHGIVGAHDDPQNFDLDRWVERLGQLLDALPQA